MTTLSLKSIPELKTLQQTYVGLRAIFFDMDGTLFNTEAYHAEAFLMMGRQHKIRPPHDPETIHQMLMGKADYLVYDIVKDWDGFPKSWDVDTFVEVKNNNLLEILAKIGPLAYFPQETLRLLQDCKNHNLFMALVTSSERVVTEKLLNMAQVEDLFDLILTRDDCPKHKPDPWPYQRAMAISQCGPKECLIFEDSHVGLAAATASGAHVIKVEWF